MVFGRHCAVADHADTQRHVPLGGDHNARLFTVATTVSSRGRDVRL